MSDADTGWICADCGTKHGTYSVRVSTWHEGICYWCGERKSVTESRDYGYPKMHSRAKRIAVQEVK